MANSPQSRASFFDDDDLNIKFDWEKSEKSPYKDILNQHPILRDNLTRTQANSQSTVPGSYVLYQRCIVQTKVQLVLKLFSWFPIE